MGKLGDWYEKNIEDPVKEAAVDVLGDDVYDVLTYGVKDLVEDLKQPGEDAKQLAKEAAEIERISTEESVRIMEEENERSVSTARARAGASGLSGASTEMYISALEETGQQDVDWLKKVGASNFEKRLTEGRLAQTQAQSAMWGTGASIVGAVTGLFG